MCPSIIEDATQIATDLVADTTGNVMVRDGLLAIICGRGQHRIVAVYEVSGWDVDLDGGSAGVYGSPVVQTYDLDALRAREGDAPDGDHSAVTN